MAHAAAADRRDIVRPGPQSDGTYLIKELGLCAYILRKAEGAELAPTSHRARDGWMLFVSVNPEDPPAGHDVIQKLMKRWATSDESQHDSMVRQIKTSIYGD